MTGEGRLHWHKPPAPTTLTFIEQAPVDPTERGLKTAFEVIAYPAGQVAVALSQISGAPRQRLIKQVVSLMFSDMREAKDAINAVLDRLDQEAELLDASTQHGDPGAISGFIQDRLSEAGRVEVPAVEAGAWLDTAGLLVDSKTRPGKPLRDLLRAGAIRGGVQRPPRPHGRWYVTRI
jgi:hypothetical protein